MPNNHTRKLKNKRLLKGRLQAPTDEFVQKFTASINFDKRLYKEDITASIAHAEMLVEIDVLSKTESSKITKGLIQIKREIESGSFQWSDTLEDIHMHIEHRLIEITGDVGKKLHTGRSRNDQIATDIRLYLRNAIDELLDLETALLSSLLDLASRNAAAAMPGFTHLQAAQPVTFGHHMMAWFEMLLRDRERLIECRRRTNVMPLGSAALAGTPFKPKRRSLAKFLGFDSISRNSLDAVSDRDFAIEFASCSAITMTHFSRWCEEIVLWSSQQFNFVSLPDAFCTGSSIMPQKKNPDVPELIRGKTGRSIGNLTSLLVLMKAQPLAYNKDNQEDKEPLFDSVETLKNSLIALLGIIPNIEVNESNMLEAALSGYSTATDLADYLVRKKVPFREAHEIVGSAVEKAISQGKMLHELTLKELNGGQTMLVGEDVYQFLSIEGSLRSRDHAGGTAPKQVKKAITAARKLI
jgi:argininosuccinate lyase